MPTLTRLGAKALILAATVTVWVAAGCSSTPSRQATAEALDRVLAGTHRSAENRARDIHRHPRETLLFFGIHPQMHVVEIWPGAGWYTEILAPLVKERGKYTAAHFPPNPESRYINDLSEKFRQKIAQQPQLYGTVDVTHFGRETGALAPPDSVDMILTFRNLHNWMGQGWAADALSRMYKALKPGGVLGVVEHRAAPDAPVDLKAQKGYVNEAHAIELIEAAGFKLVAKSEINANPRDTKDYEQGVWTLPPTYRLGDKDREKYAAIGESDRFTLKFIKPR